MTEIHTNYVPLVHLEMVKERFVPYGVAGNIDTPEKVVNMANIILKADENSRFTKKELTTSLKNKNTLDNLQELCKNTRQK